MKLLLISCLCYTAFSKEEDVIDLGDSDFSTKLAEHETALVMFYAPWWVGFVIFFSMKKYAGYSVHVKHIAIIDFWRCGHCKRLKPEYAKAAEELVRNDPPITLFKVDCTEAGKETCNKNSVNGYPTLKIFRNGEFSQEYNGPREASG